MAGVLQKRLGMSFRKILCPIDFSEGSARAMALAVRIAQQSDAELVLFHAWQVPGTLGEHAFARGVVEDIEDAAERCLEDALRDAKALGAAKATATLVNGPAWWMIVETLRTTPFDLAVMGTQGRSGIRRFLLGSVAEKVVRQAPCPVLTIRPEGELVPFKNVLVPVDFSSSSHDALKLAAQLVASGGDGVTLLHVVEVPVSYRGELTVPGVGEVLDRHAADMLERWAAELRAEVSVPVRTRWHVGWPGPEILSAIEDSGFDLVVMGSHGRTGIKRALIGSIAEKVVRHSPCAVAISRRPRLEQE